MESLLRGGPLTTSVSDTVSSLSNVHSQLVAQMMGHCHTTTNSAHDMFDGTELNESAEPTFPSDVSVPTNSSSSEKRKRATPAVKLGM